MFNNLIFDFDGCIADTSDNTMKYLKLVLDECGASYDETKLIKEIVMVQPFGIIMKTLQVSGDIQEITTKFINSRIQNITDGIRLYPQMKTLLQDAKNSGQRLFIATNKFQQVLATTLQSLDIDMFDDARTLDTGLTKAEMVADLVDAHKMNKDKSVMIGDSVKDIDAGIKAGIKTIAADWGYDANKAELKQTTDFYVESVNKLKELLELK